MDAAALSRPTGKVSEWSPGTVVLELFSLFSFLRAILKQVLVRVLVPYLMGIIRNWGGGQPRADSTTVPVPQCY